MYNNDIKKGSVWLKWDCHVHTPISYENNFSDFDEYVEKLKNKAIEHKMDVIIINDYFTLDGYKELIGHCSRANIDEAYKLKINEEKSLTILPGLELRIDNFTQRENSINIHIFFNQRLSPDNIQSAFLNQLEISYGGYEGLKADRQTLMKIGYSIITNEPYNDNLDTSTLQDYKKYINKAISIITVTKESINKTIEQFKARYRDNEQLKDNCMLLVVAFNGYGALSELSWTEARAGNVKRQLLYAADICFSARDKDVNFLLGNDPSTSKDEIKNLFKRLKPCVWGSDSHEIETLLHPSRGNTNKYTWIKGMNTFEGLKQIVFEPENRVRIQEDRPSSKSDYQVIDKVRFVDNNNLFIKDDIIFNEDLNTIIGGKSSGKSLLLSHIARTVNGSGENFGNYANLQSKYDYDFEVHWNDGEVSKLSLNGKKPIRRVKYISQMFVNKLAEDKNNDLKKIVTEVLMENPKIKNNYDILYANLTEINLQMNNKVYQIEKIIDDYRNKNEERMKIGDLEGINKEISKLIELINNLVKESQMSSEDIDKYNTINNKITNNTSRIQKIKNIIIPEVTKYKNYFENILADIKSELQLKWLNSKSVLCEEFDVTLPNLIFDTTKLNIYIDEKISMLNDTENKLNAEIERLIKENAEFKLEISGYEVKLKNKTQIDNLNTKLEEERAKKEKIQEIEKVIASKKVELTQVLEDINSAICRRKNEYETLIDILNQDEFKYISDDTNLTLNFELKIQEEILKDDIGNLLNKTSVEVKELLENNIDLNSYNKFIMDTIKKSLTSKGNYKYKNGKNYLDLIKALVKNNYDLNVDIRENEDSFNVMSPGKQGLIVLKLLIHLSSEKYPILIDQPEDNLDNRTISCELKNFILDKKKERQIIMVTHNPNLTVLADSDEIIVANQSGKDGKGNKECRFEYVSGPLELSFRNEDESVLFSRGIKEHVCEILEGGKEAFKQRENKYGF